MSSHEIPECAADAAPAFEKLPDKRPIKLRHHLQHALYTRKGTAGALLHVLHGWLKTSNVPVPGMQNIHPLLKPKNNWVMTVPVNIEIESESVVLPVDMLRKLIDTAGYIHIMDSCVCRTGGDCQNHRHDIGCMFLGASGLEVAPPLSHPATREEAYAHVDAAVADGLVPTTMRIRADNYAFMFPDHHTIMAICFCCDCCCYMQYYRDVPARFTDKIVHPVPGARLEFNPAICAACTEHACQRHCYMHNISHDEQGHVVLGDHCVLCGRCASHCPHGSARIVSDAHEPFETRLADIAQLGDLKAPLPGK